MKKYFLYFIILVNASLNAQVANGNFELGPASGWTQYSKEGYGLIGTADFLHFSEVDPPVYPRSGQYMARIGGFNYEENYIKQTVTVPNTSQVYLQAYYQDRASTGSECAGLYAGAQIRAIVGNEVISDVYLCHYNTVDQWTYIYADISKFAGQTVEIGFRADAASSVWSFLYLDDISISSTLTSVENTDIPVEFNLHQNYPNPFNPSTTIHYEVPSAGFIKITVTDLLGQQVAELINDYQPAGSYDLSFNAASLSSGTYIYNLITDSKVLSRKMILIK